MGELKRIYPGIRTHLISYRVSSWSDTDLSAQEMVDFEYNLNRSGLMPLPLEGIIPHYRFGTNDYILDPTDSHPKRARTPAHSRVHPSGDWMRALRPS